MNVIRHSLSRIGGLTLIVATVGCDGSPGDTKPRVFEDHTADQGGAFHKEGYEQPFASEGRCATFSCHHADLRGGWALDAEEQGTDAQRYAPSCYQCHGVEWEDTRPRGLRVLYPTNDVVWRHGQSRVIEHWARGVSSESIDLLRGETVVASFVDMRPVEEVFRVALVDPEWGTGTDYRVRVTSNTGEMTTGPGFSVCGTDSVVVTVPLPGTVFSPGDEIRVEWTCATGVAVDIEVIRLGRRVGDFRDGAGNTGFHSRTVPVEWGVGAGFRLRIVDFEGVHGTSAPFDIVASAAELAPRPQR